MRPTKLTPEIQKTIVELLRRGNYIETAAVFAGIDKKTFYNWMKRGNEATSGKYNEFFHAVEQAMAEAEIRDVANITNAAKTNWKASAWRLQHRNPRKWGKIDEEKRELELQKIKAEIELIEERTKLIKGAVKDTSLLEALIKTVNSND